jgi:hypothetical protein
MTLLWVAVSRQRWPCCTVQNGSYLAPKSRGLPDIGDGERHPVRMLMRWPLAAYACSISNGTGLNKPGSLHADCDDHSTTVQMPLRGLRPARTRRRQRLALPQPERQRCRRCGQRRVRNRQNSSALADTVGSPFGSQGASAPLRHTSGSQLCLVSASPVWQHPGWSDCLRAVDHNIA